jgi:hypothetical protein
MHAQLSRERQAGTTTSADRIRGSSVVAAPVRGRPCKAGGPSHRSLAPIPVRYASVGTATQRPTALQDDTRRDKGKRPASYENSHLAGHNPRWWQVLGSNQRRLSRRFYSTLAPPRSPPADQRIRRSGRVGGPPPSAMRPWAPGFGVRVVHGRARTSPRTGAEKATDGRGKGHGRGRWERLRQPPVAFTWDFSIFTHNHRLLRLRASDSVAHKAGTRTLHSPGAAAPLPDEATRL